MASRKMNNDETGLVPVEATGFYSWNVQENRVFGDDVIAFVFGVPARELSVGAPVEVLLRHVDDGDRQRLAKAIHEAIITGDAFYSDYSVTHPDGRHVFVSANGRCLRDPQGVPSIYSGTVTLRSLAAAGELAVDPLESHCRAALGLANSRRHALAARYLSSALTALGGKCSGNA